jgi:Cu(I)/Ag(I) efflux system membrane fusion protein
MIPPQRIAILVATLLSGLVVGCSDKSGESEPIAKPPLVAVKVARVERGAADSVIVLRGGIEMLRTVKIIAPISGTLIRYDLPQGSSVRKGSLVAVIRPRESVAQIEGANALRSAARTPEEKAEAERIAALATSVDNSARVVSPESGVVITRGANLGELVSEGGELASIVDLSSIVFTAELPLSLVAEVHIGMPCTVELASFPGRTFDGRVEKFTQQADGSSRTIGLRIRVASLASSDARLSATGMPGIASIVLQHRPDALLVPKNALIRNDDENSYSMMILLHDSLALSVKVTPGMTVGERVEIEGKDINVGTPVIIEGQWGLADSTHVKVMP